MDLLEKRTKLTQAGFHVFFSNQQVLREILAEIISVRRNIRGLQTGRLGSRRVELDSICLELVNRAAPKHSSSLPLSQPISY